MKKLWQWELGEFKGKGVLNSSVLIRWYKCPVVWLNVANPYVLVELNSWDLMQKGETFIKLFFLEFSIDNDDRRGDQDSFLWFIIVVLVFESFFFEMSICWSVIMKFKV